MILAIHQPNFFPWVGIFHRISMVDKFIFLDHVQAPRGKSWLSRNKIIVNGEPKWLTIPTMKSGRSYQKISEIFINYDNNFERKHLGTIKQAYGKCSYFSELYPLIESLYKKKYEKLADFNKEYIRLVSKKLDLMTIFLSSTELINENKSLGNLKGNALILNLCLHVGAKQYISGEGCLEFIDPREFEKNGIAFRFQNFLHPEYKQENSNKFISNLSSIDAIFNLGFNGLKNFIYCKNI